MCYQTAENAFPDGAVAERYPADPEFPRFCERFGKDSALRSATGIGGVSTS